MNKSIIAFVILVTLVVGLYIGFVFGSAITITSPNVKTITHIHYVTETIQTKETRALKQCANASNNEENSALGSPKVFGECVYWVEKAFKVNNSNSKGKS
jgi:hypothetical protein